MLPYVKRMRTPKERDAGPLRRRRLGAAAAVLALWLALTGGEWALFAVGVGLAGGVFATDPLRHRPELRLPRLWPLLLYLPGFAWRSVAGAIDVARRVFDPALPIKPGFRTRRSRAPNQAVRACHLGAVSLLPGSLAAGTEGCVDHVHLLTDAPWAIEAVDTEETRLGRLFLESPGR
ncbi:MAG: hypothetical protein EA356_02465 [Geminicoccaceae bacterium]|nr:MAG: hypothetical protein EA356_02465 [Geminicoccaceae bacterium]